MSGVRGRINGSEQVDGKIIISGFNGSRNSATTKGRNDDGKPELFVDGMPSDLSLLCGRDYASDGAIVLFSDGGQVLNMSVKEQQELRDYIKRFSTLKELVVENRVYCVKQSPTSTRISIADEKAMSSTATRYFNSKVHVSTVDERILATLLCGLSFEDVYMYAMKGERGSPVPGFPRDITVSRLNSWANRYGRTPSVVQMALPNKSGNSKGYMAPAEVLSRPAQRMEMYKFSSDYNYITFDKRTNTKKTLKIKSYGGATEFWMLVCCFTGYPYGWMSSDPAPLANVKRAVELVSLDGKKIGTFAADIGVSVQSMYNVMVPKVQEFLQQKLIKNETGEAYRHYHGVPKVENVGGRTKELICFAITYILNNPNFELLGFQRIQIFKLHGQLFYWALWVQRLKISWNNELINRFESYHGQPLDLRIIRLLPIFAIVFVMRYKYNPLDANRKFWQLGLYVGPSERLPGGYVVAVLTKTKKLVLVHSTDIKGVSDGGDLNPYTSVNNSIQQYIEVTPNDTQLDSTSRAAAPALPTNYEVNVEDASDIDEFDGNIQPVDNSRGASVSAIVPDVTSTADDRTIDNSRGASVAAGDIAPQVSSAAVDDVNRVSSRKAKAQQRAARLQRRNEIKEMSALSLVTYIMTHSQPEAPVTNGTILSRGEVEEESYFSDWSTMHDDEYYFSVTLNSWVKIRNPSIEDWQSLPDDVKYASKEERYRAVTTDVPKKYADAVRHSKQGDPARTEFELLREVTGTLIQVPRSVALENIGKGANCLTLFPVYEEKFRDGQMVYKVRLVANGKQHTRVGSTYAPTPSREEFFI